MNVELPMGPLWGRGSPVPINQIEAEGWWDDIESDDGLEEAVSVSVSAKVAKVPRALPRLYASSSERRSGRDKRSGQPSLGSDV